MKFILFVEGHTEAKCLPEFFGRWINPKLKFPVGFKTVNFQGCFKFIKEAPAKAVKYLDAPNGGDIISVVGLLDLYGPEYPRNLNTVDEKVAWLKDSIIKAISGNHQDKYIQSFAVHELEAWLLSQPGIFPRTIQDHIARHCPQPETVDNDEPPKKFLRKLYSSKLKSDYKERSNGGRLFGKLDPEIVYRKCPRFKDLMDELLAKAAEAGL